MVNHPENIVTISTRRMLKTGLKLFYSRKKISSAGETTNRKRFKHFFGASPEVVVAIWNDLQTTEVEDAFVPPDKREVTHLLMALHQLKRYPTEHERESLYDGIGKNKARQVVWYFIKKIQALKAQKIVWPEDNFGDDILVISVDGTHCWINEPVHPEFSQDSGMFSHKFQHAGLDYELGISLTESKLVWMNGPFPAGNSDRQIFVEQGLKDKLVATGKKAIGDAGYVGHQEAIITPNSHDADLVKTFKSRASKRHETFNGLIKQFQSLSQRFRHKMKDGRFKQCFEAICVICQYQIEIDLPLFDIVIDGMEGDEFEADL